MTEPVDRVVLPEVHVVNVATGKKRGSLCVMMSLAAYQAIMNDEPDPPRQAVLATAHRRLFRDLESVGARMVLDTDIMSHQPWVTVYLRRPFRLMEQEVKAYVRGFISSFARTPFEVFHGRPDPASLVYIWARVLTGRNYKLDIVTFTFSTPQLRVIFNLPETSPEASPEMLAGRIAEYVNVPGVKLGDELIPPDFDPETITLFFSRWSGEQYLAGVPARSSPVVIPGIGAHYAIMSSRERGDLYELRSEPPPRQDGDDES